jgi:hypothetical protein
VTAGPGCRARPDPVVAVEAFIRGRPGEIAPDDLADALCGEVPPPVVAEVVAYLLSIGRLGLDRDGHLVTP